MVSVCFQNSHKEKERKYFKSWSWKYHCQWNCKCQQNLVYLWKCFHFFKYCKINSRSSSSIKKATLISIFRRRCWALYTVKYLLPFTVQLAKTSQFIPHDWSQKSLKGRRIQIQSYRLSAYIDSLHFNLHLTLSYMTVFKCCFPSQWPKSAVVANVVILQHNHTISDFICAIFSELRRNSDGNSWLQGF